MQVDGLAAAEATLAAISAHTEIAQTVAAMPQVQLQLCLGTMKRLAVEAPEHARAMLQDNPQMCYALLHAQLLLGLTTDSKQMPDAAEIAQLRAEHAAYRPMMPMSVPPGSGVVVPPTANPGAPRGAFVPARPAFAGARPAPYPAPPPPG